MNERRPREKLFEEDLRGDMIPLVSGEPLRSKMLRVRRGRRGGLVWRGLHEGGSEGKGGYSPELHGNWGKEG